jgi:hypothetical protein
VRCYNWEKFPSTAWEFHKNAQPQCSGSNCSSFGDMWSGNGRAFSEGNNGPDGVSQLSGSRSVGSSGCLAFAAAENYSPAAAQHERSRQHCCSQPSQPSPKTGTPVDFSPLDYAQWRASRYAQRSLPGWLAAAAARGKRATQTNFCFLLWAQARGRKNVSGGDALRQGRKSEFGQDPTLLSKSAVNY